MKVKTALRFYLTPIRVTIIKKLNDKKCMQGFWKEEALLVVEL